MKPGISLLLCAVVTLLASRPAHAVGRLADLSVVDRTNGAVLPVYYAHGTYWIAGTPGRRYGLLIRNALGERVLAVASVDGINVISGATAAVDKVGYVLGPRERYEIDGWRKSDNEVAAFEFVASPQSYAERTGRASNVGVVGVATGDCGTVNAADAASTAATTAAGGLESMKALWVAMARVHSCTEGARGSTRPTRQ